MVTAGFAVIAGAGVALGFTVFANSSTWYLVLVAVITLGVYPPLAGWLSPPLRNVALFPISVLFALSVAWAIGGPLFSDSHPIWVIFVLTIFYGGGASAAFCVAWIARQYLLRLQGHRMVVSHLTHCVIGGCLYSMPPWISESWLKEHGCARRDLGDVPIPFVWMPDFNEPPMFDLATYGETDGEPGCYELEWFS